MAVVTLFNRLRDKLFGLKRKSIQKHVLEITREQEVFLITVFKETNEHLRATDNKNVTVGGFFITLVSVLGGILLDKIATVGWSICLFSLAILIIGYCLILLQIWYRKWKEHYLHVCKNIAASYQMREELLPCWLHISQKGTQYRFSADTFIFIVSIVIEIIIFLYFIYLISALLFLSKVPALLDITITVIIISLSITSVLVGRLLLSPMEA